MRLVRSTRVLTVVALLALAGGIVSDAVVGGFWTRHALLAGLTASVIVVMLSVAVINEALDRRRRERWSILAQFVMFELVRNARLVWTGVLAQVGLLPPEAVRPESVDANRRTVRDTPRLTAAVRDAIADDDLRRGLREEIAVLADHTDEALGRWATVMLNADVYAEVIDRHVELAGDISWLIGCSTTPIRRRTPVDSVAPAAAPPSRSTAGSPATRSRTGSSSSPSSRRSSTTAPSSSRKRIVPVDWWKSRLGATATATPR